MPCQLIYLTDKPTRETGPKKQDLRLSVEVGAMEELTLVATLYEGTDVNLQVLTSMQIDSDSPGWVALTPAFSLLTTSSPTSKITVTGLLRYVRWEITSSGTTTFMIAGVARSHC